MKPRLGLVLGSGSARGWAHIGVIRALADAGYEPDVLAGCSIGALVGVAHASGNLDRLEGWVRTLAWKDVLGLLDVSFSGGLIKGDKLVAFFQRHFEDPGFGGLARPFACVATDLASGREIWLRDGDVVSAVRASSALPGLFRPVERGGKLLVDGGLVNPVPVSLARAMDAEVVIAVDLGSDIVGSALRRNDTDVEENGNAESWSRRLLHRFGWARNDHADAPPSLAGVMATSIHIMQARIARSRLAGEPADVLLAPRLGHLALMDYHRGDEAIKWGRAAVQRMLPAIEHAMKS